MTAIYIYSISISLFAILAAILVYREQMKWVKYPSPKNLENVFRKVKYHYFYRIKISDPDFLKKYDALKLAFFNRCSIIKPGITLEETDFINFIEYSNKFCPKSSLSDAIKNYVE